MSPKIDRYVAISNAIKSILLDYGLPDERITVVRSAVPGDSFKGISKDTAKAALIDELDLPPGIPIIASVAYLTHQKGHKTLLDGLKVVKDAGQPFTCLIAGDGELKTELLAQRQALGLEHDVHFLGIRQDVPKILKAADILAMPSNAEGLGTTILDALLADCCVVATQVGGIPEIITHEQTGLLSAVGDGQGHGTNLLRALKSPAYAQTLAQEGKRHVEQEFSVDHMVRGNLAVYKDLVQA